MARSLTSNHTSILVPSDSSFPHTVSAAFEAANPMEKKGARCYSSLVFRGRVQKLRITLEEVISTPTSTIFFFFNTEKTSSDIFPRVFRVPYIKLHIQNLKILFTHDVIHNAFKTVELVINNFIIKACLSETFHSYSYLDSTNILMYWSVLNLALIINSH